MITLGKNFTTTKSEWVGIIVAYMKNGSMSRLSIPPKPVVLRPWSVEMIREANLSTRDNDRQMAKIWRKWIQDVEWTEMENRDRLRQLLGACATAVDLGLDDMAVLIRTYLISNWDIGDALYKSYKESRNRIGWIKEYANFPNGPTVLERDPFRVR